MLAPQSRTESARVPSVLVVTTTFPRWPNDATPRFVRDLAELATPAWNVTVLAPHHAGALLHEPSPRLDVRRFRYWFPTSRQRLCYGGGILPNARTSRLARLQVPTLALSEALAMRRVLRRKEVDLVHAHWLVPQGAIAALTTQHRLVVSIHGSDLFALRGSVVDALVRRVIARASLVTVNGTVAANEVTRRFPEVAHKLRLLPMGFDPERFRPPTEDEAREPASRPLIAFVGRLSEQKGVHILLDAFARLERDARLVVVGDGPPGELERLRACARGNVEFLGPLGPTDVARLLRRATLLAVPSLEGPIGVEAQGLVAVEAMASKCPVVTTTSGGLAPLASEGRGLVVPPSDPAALADAIARALDDEPATRARAEIAYDFVRARYDRARVGAALLAIYDEALRC
jgi:glycosyltransferase involved in cell wall biosynthesis